jgi:hypothetical protein
MALRKFVLVLGAVLIVVGLAGFAKPDLLNLVHLALGAAGTIAAFVTSTRRELPFAGLGREAR